MVDSIEHVCILRHLCMDPHSHLLLHGYLGKRQVPHSEPDVVDTQWD